MPPAAESFDAAEERRIAKAGEPPAPKRRPGRLTRSADFERVYRQGRSQANRHLVVHAFPRAGGGAPRVGVSVSRKVGGAVERNRVKRVLREAFDRGAGLAPGRERHRRRCAPACPRPRRARGPGGRRRRPARAVDRRDRRRGLVVSAMARRIAVAPIELYRRVLSPAAAGKVQVRAELLGLRRAGDPGVRHTARARAGGLARSCAATRGATAGTTRRTSSGSSARPERLPPDRALRLRQHLPAADRRRSMRSSCSSTTTSWAAAGACRSSRSRSWCAPR